MNDTPKVHNFEPKVVGLSRQEKEFQASALRVLRHAIAEVEAGGWCHVAMILSDMEGAGTEMWSRSPHRAATMGLLQTMIMRMGNARIDDNEIPPEQIA